MSLTPAEIRRYGRHLVMPEVGREGQERLKRARVLLVGAGGLGSPAALYMAAAGVGHLGIVEFDRVDESNLQRQILYGSSDVDRPKLEAAVERLSEINPHVEVAAIDERLDGANARDLVEAHDVVVDGSDNFPTRYLVNDACVLTRTPDVFGSVLRFEGQVSVFATPGGPCYRCLYPEPPPPGQAPSCAEAGVLGVLPGIIGALQAHEAIRLVLGLGRPLVGRLLVFDGVDLRFREIAVPRDPECRVCSQGAAEIELVEYDDRCASEAPMDGASAEDRGLPFDISPAELQERLGSDGAPRIVDVRTPMEFSLARIEGSTLLPLNELTQRLDELQRGEEVAVICHHGPRSSQAVAFLRQMGFVNARNVAGGIDAWSREVDSRVPRY
jgi:adenylyltransferase/sulfurtransferase